MCRDVGGSRSAILSSSCCQDSRKPEVRDLLERGPQLRSVALIWEFSKIREPGIDLKR